MEKIIKNENQTKYYLNDELLLTITELGNNNYIVENRFRRLEGYCKNLDKYRTECGLDIDFNKEKNKKLRRNLGLFKHDENWFCYILREKGFVAQTLPIY